MSKYKEFWLQADKKDIQTFEYLASDTPCYDDDIHVIEKSYADELERKLKVAVEALEWMQKYRNTTLFIEEPAHIEHFFKKAKKALAEIRKPIPFDVDEFMEENAELMIALGDE